MRRRFPNPPSRMRSKRCAGEADLCIIPVENSLHGRIADIHHLLPEAGLYIVGEHFHARPPSIAGA